jgi:hypothetical protein
MKEFYLFSIAISSLADFLLFAFYRVNIQLKGQNVRLRCNENR